MNAVQCSLAKLGSSRRCHAKFSGPQRKTETNTRPGNRQESREVPGEFRRGEKNWPELEPGDELAARRPLVACSAAVGWPIVFRRGFASRSPRRTRATLGRRTHMHTTVLCSQCDQPESKCTCERYCCYCQGLERIRLCTDGQYYCPDCREACEIGVAQSDE